MDSENYTTPCLQCRGTGVGSQSCAILKHEYCQQWQKAIPRLEQFILSKHPWFKRYEIHDIIQDTFLGVCARINDFLGESSFFTWVRVICNYKRIDYGREHLKDKPFEQLPFLPEELKKFCNRKNDHLALYPNKKLGMLKKIISEQLSEDILNALQDISKRPSWKKSILSLQKKGMINIQNKDCEPDIIKICEIYPNLLIYEKCKPSCKLYAIDPPLIPGIKEELLNMSAEPAWREAINRLADSNSYDAWREITLPPMEDDQEDSFDKDIGDNPDDRSIETKLVSEKNLKLIEQHNKDCFKFLRDVVIPELQGKALQDIAIERGVKPNTLSKQKTRYLAQIKFYPDDDSRMILPGNTVRITEITAKTENNFIWCRTQDGFKVRSKKKLREEKIAFIQEACENSGGIDVVLVGQQKTEKKDDYFFTFRLPGI